MLLLVFFFQKAKFGLFGGLFFNEFVVFALKNTQFFSPAAGCRTLVFIILQKISPAACFYYFSFFKIFLLLLFSQNPDKISSCFYYSIFKGGFLLLIARYTLSTVKVRPILRIEGPGSQIACENTEVRTNRYAPSGYHSWIPSDLHI